MWNQESSRNAESQYSLNIPSNTAIAEATTCLQKFLKRKLLLEGPLVRTSLCKYIIHYACVYVNIHIYTHLHAHTHTHIYIYIHTYTYVYVYIYITYVCVYKYNIHIRVYIRILCVLPRRLATVFFLASLLEAGKCKYPPGLSFPA